MSAARNRKKRIFLSVALGIVILFEAYLSTAFLPDNWQRAVNRRLTYLFSRQFYDQSLITHPAMEPEIDQVLMEHPAFKTALYLTFGTLLTGNTLLMAQLLLALKRRV